MWHAETAAQRSTQTLGHCKRHDTLSCQTERDDEIAILAAVNLADHTGEWSGVEWSGVEWSGVEIERILVDEQNLQALAAVASKEELLTLLQKRGPAGICFKHPVDVRLATNNRKAGIFTIQCACCRFRCVADARE